MVGPSRKAHRNLVLPSDARFRLTLLVLLLSLPGPICFPAEAANEVPNPGVPWPAVDSLDRALPQSEEVGPPRPGRFVGIFYFLWHQDVPRRSPSEPGPLDIARINAARHQLENRIQFHNTHLLDGLPPDWNLLAWSAAVALAVFVIGFTYFRRAKDDFESAL